MNLFTLRNLGGGDGAGEEGRAGRAGCRQRGRHGGGGGEKAGRLTPKEGSKVRFVKRRVLEAVEDDRVDLGELQVVPRSTNEWSTARRPR